MVRRRSPGSALALSGPGRALALSDAPSRTMRRVAIFTP
jgi:hypothetical protein